MVDKPALESRIRRIIMAVVLNILLLLPIPLASSFGCPRNRMSSPLVEMLPNKVLVLTSRIDIAKRGAVEIDLLGGDNCDNTHSTDDRYDRNSRGDKSYRGDKDLSKWDQDHRPRGDTAKSVSEGGDRKRNRPSPSRDHQAARVTVASGDGQRDDSDESSSSEESD